MLAWRQRKMSVFPGTESGCLQASQPPDIARLPLSDLHTALRHDGAPPLYYALLHFWTSAFGTGDFAARSLSGFPSVATLPPAWFASQRLGARRLRHHSRRT